MKYTVINIKEKCNVEVPSDTVVIGVDYTWKYYPDLYRVYFTRFDAFMEFINVGNEKYGVPICGNDLVNDANRAGRFNVLRNLIRSKKLQYYDTVGDYLTNISNIMAGSQYINAAPAKPRVHTYVASEKEKLPIGPLVSVIIPHYNRSEIVKSSLASILNQTYTNIEVLLVDDCSEENDFANLVKHLALVGDSRVRLYRMSKNCGPYVCKNEMIRVAAGQYITMQDSDDTSDPTRIEEEVKNMSYPDVVACSVQTYRSNTKETHAYCMAAAMYDKRVFSDVGFFDCVKYGADSEFNHRVRMYYGHSKIKTVEKSLYHAGFSQDCLTSKVPQGSRTRNDYYAASILYLQDARRENMYLPYPCNTKRFKTPEEMLVDVTGVTCDAVPYMRSNIRRADYEYNTIKPPMHNGKTVIFNQFFGLGDILFIEPIMRRYFINGYRVKLPVVKKLLCLQPYIPYVEFIDMDQCKINYEEQRIIDTGDTVILPMRWSMEFLNGQLKDTMRNKYAMLGLNMEEWRNLRWYRHRYKEQRLMEDLQLPEKYTLVNGNYHTFKDGRREIKPNNGLPVVEMSFMPGYTLLDWAGVIENATSIHTVNTSILYLVETLPIKAEDLHIYSRNVNGDDFKQVEYLFGRKWIKHN